MQRSGPRPCLPHPPASGRAPRGRTRIARAPGGRDGRCPDRGLAKQGRGIRPLLRDSGPQGVQATFDWRAARNVTLGHIRIASLDNDIEEY